MTTLMRTISATEERLEEVLHESMRAMPRAMSGIPRAISATDEIFQGIIHDSHYHNEDLAPVPKKNRTWTTLNYLALWCAMILNLATWFTVTSFVEGGLGYGEAVLVVIIGSLLTVPGIVLNGRPGSKYGIPFPVLVRASFGMRGAQVPTFMRALVACGWFGIQSWMGGNSLYQITTLWIPQIRHVPRNGGAFIFFAIFWAINLLIALMGMEMLRKLLSLKSIILIGVSLSLLIWSSIVAAQTHEVDLRVRPEAATKIVTPDFWAACVTSVIGGWATLSLNIPDFTRYAKNDRSQVIGQTIGLPTNMVLFGLVAVMVTAASSVHIGHPIYDPVELIAQSGSTTLKALAQLCVAFSVLTTNLAANVVGPANDFANMAPKYISYRTGCVITAVVGIAICPWKLMSSAEAFIFQWLVAYASLLGPVLGIMLADYYILRGQHLHIHGLYSASRTGPYWYRNGIHPPSIIALLLGVAPNIPGFLAANLPNLPTSPFLKSLYSYSWGVGLLVASLSYVCLCRYCPSWWWGLKFPYGKDEEEEDSEVDRTVHDGGSRGGEGVVQREQEMVVVLVGEEKDGDRMVYPGGKTL